MTADPMTALRDNLELLGIALAMWATRDDKPRADVTRSGHEAVGAIDVMLRDLHQLRARLVTENRAHADESAARAGALLARYRSTAS